MWKQSDDRWKVIIIAHPGELEIFHQIHLLSRAIVINGYFQGETTLVRRFCLPPEKGRKFFPFRVNPFSEGGLMYRPLKAC